MNNTQETTWTPAVGDVVSFDVHAIGGRVERVSGPITAVRHTRTGRPLLTVQTERHGAVCPEVDRVTLETPAELAAHDAGACGDDCRYCAAMALPWGAEDDPGRDADRLTICDPCSQSHLGWSPDMGDGYTFTRATCGLCHAAGVIVFTLDRGTFNEARAEVAYDAQDQDWFNALPTADLVALWAIACDINRGACWDDEVYEALAARGHFTDAARCAWDSGTATGCQPACNDPATHAVTYDAAGHGGPYVTNLCTRHARVLPARIWPATVLETKEI